MEKIRVHPRIHERHSDITDKDVQIAWHNAIAFARRENAEKDYYVAVGTDNSGRLIEIVAAREESGSLLAFHAMTPPTKKTLVELKLIRR